MVKESSPGAVTLGVDLGTTFVAAATNIGGRVEAVALGNRSTVLPSTVFVHADGSYLVGEAADARAFSDPGRYAREFKRRLGDPIPLVLGGVPYGAETLSGHLLSEVVRRSRERIGRPIDRLIVTHPASYAAYRLEILGQAVAMSGVDSTALLAEPVAAALEYGSRHSVGLGDSMAVYDLGGGTFDAAVVQRVEGGFRLLGQPKGIDRLGGIDFDAGLFGLVNDRLDGALDDLETQGLDASLVLAAIHREVRQAKELLSEDVEATVSIGVRGLPATMTLSRSDLERVVAQRLPETFTILESAVRSSNLALKDVSIILLVGGSTRIPLVRRLITEWCGRPMAVDIDPDLGVALGAARSATASSSASDRPSSVPGITPTPTVPTSLTAPTQPAAPSVLPLPAPLPAQRQDLGPPLQPAIVPSSGRPDGGASPTHQTAAGAPPQRPSAAGAPPAPPLAPPTLPSSPSWSAGRPDVPGPANGGSTPGRQAFNSATEVGLRPGDDRQSRRGPILIGVGVLVAISLVLGIAIFRNRDDGGAASVTTSPKKSATTVPTTKAKVTTTTEGSTSSTAGATTAAPVATTVVTATTTAVATTPAAPGVLGTTVDGKKVAMTVTMELDPKAVWDDGTPITIDDFRCTLDAVLHTPGTLFPAGWDQVVRLDAGANEHEIVALFSSVYAPYKNVFSGLLERKKITNCSDVGTEMQESIPFSGRQWKLTAFSTSGLTLTRNDAYWGTDKAVAASAVVTAEPDSDAEVAALKSGAVDFIFPQAFNGLTSQLSDPNVALTPGFGTNFEAVYFNQQSGPFADATFRQAFAKSFDRGLMLTSIYGKIFPGVPLLNCGQWVPNIGPWCNNADFATFFDPAGAQGLLTNAGWSKNADGFWADPSGKVPTIRWMVNAGNTRRENSQALMIPEFTKSGFKVVADNCDAACVFQKRLPGLDFDMAMYINTVSPDPSVTLTMSCGAIPSAANNNVGQNTTGWCDQEASALMAKSDSEIDQAQRTATIHQIGALMVKDAVLLPMFQFPNVAAWRSDTLAGPVDKDAGNFQAWQNLWEWQPKNGDTIRIGAEQFPTCLNPITECANSSWYQWLVQFKVLPNVWDTTPAGEYVTTSLVTAEPVVNVAP